MLDRLRHDPERLVWFLAVVAWIAQPFTLGLLLGDALDPARSGFRTFATWTLWGWWLAVLVTLALPRPLLLTASRLGVTAAVPTAVWAAVESDDNALRVVGLVAAAAAAGLVLTPAFADRFVDGASYGDERRFVLRPPGPVLVALVVPSWVVFLAGLTLGPILLANQRWVAGGIALVVGWPLAVLAARALHQLSRRFVVFVPNGFVVHDLTVLREPVLFATRDIVAIGPALADTTAPDFTNQALGLALELKLRRSVTVPAVTGRTETTEQDIHALLLSPSRPAAVMRVAADRGVTIG